MSHYVTCWNLVEFIIKKKKKKKEKKETYPLLVWINISNAKVVFLQQVEMVANEVKQVLSLGIPLKEKWYEKIHKMYLLLKDSGEKETEQSEDRKFISQESSALILSTLISARSRSQLMNLPQINVAYVWTLNSKVYTLPRNSGKQHHTL